jgi:hypothetical protein
VPEETTIFFIAQSSSCNKRSTDFQKKMDGLNIPPDEENEMTVNRKLKLTSFDIWALGITVVIG